MYVGRYLGRFTKECILHFANLDPSTFLLFLLQHGTKSSDVQYVQYLHCSYVGDVLQALHTSPLLPRQFDAGWLH